ncbi:MAG: hypothetical protein JXR76_04465 [Deltaproteobacteria bacterium]|nr:hypothetical protein [Deltaproteobacteria bacterium]
MRIIIVGLTIFLISATALGGPKKFKCPAVPGQESLAVKKAGKYFAAGQKMAVQGFYKKSLERYLCSLKMKEHPNTMFNIAQVAKLIDNKKPALHLLKKFRENHPEHPSANEIDQLIAKMEKGEYDTINADDPPEESLPNEFEDAMVATTEPEAAPPTEASEPEPSIAKGNSAPTEQQVKKRRITGILLIVGGTVFTGMGIGFAIGASLAKDNALSADAYNDYERYDKQRQGFAALSVTSFVLGAAGLTTGLIFLIRSRKHNQSSNQLSPSTSSAKVRFQPGVSGVSVTF